MRNLKKVLALVLAMMMAFSLMVTVNAIQFKDVSDVDPRYAEAVDVVSALDVLSGDDNGNLNPKATMNRAQFAVVLYKLSTGDSKVKALDKTPGVTTGYSDVDGNATYAWAAPYINYVHAHNLLNGVGGDKFGPERTVTGEQLALPILKLMGYGMAGEFSGTWAETCLNIAVWATRSDLVLGFGSSLKNDLTNEQLAYLLFNGLTQPMVSYNATGGNYVGTPGTSTNLGKVYFGLDTITSSNPTSVDAYGRPNAPKWGATVDGVSVTAGAVANTAVQVYTEAVDVSDILDVFGAGVTSPSQVRWYEDGQDMTIPDSDGTVGGNGVRTELFAYGPANSRSYLVVVINPYVVQLSEKAITPAKGTNPATVTLAANLTYKTDAFAAGDVILYTKGWDSTNSKPVVASAEVLEKVASGLIAATGKDADGNPYVRVGESRYYPISCYTAVPATDGKTVYDVYADQYDYVYLIDPNGAVKNTAVTAEQYYYVKTAQGYAGNAGTDITGTVGAAVAKAELVNLTTGASEIINLKINAAGTETVDKSGNDQDKLNSVGSDGTLKIQGSIVTANIKDGVGVLTEIGSLTDPDNHAWLSTMPSHRSGLPSAGNPMITAGTTTKRVYYCDNDTNLVVLSYNAATGKYTATTMKGYNSFTYPQDVLLQCEALVVETDAADTVLTIYVLMRTNTAVVPTDDNYAIYVGQGETTATYIEYNFYVDGELVTYVDETKKLTVVGVGDVCIIATDGNKLVSCNAPNTTNNHFVTGQSIVFVTDSFVIAGGVVYNIDDSSIGYFKAAATGAYTPVEINDEQFKTLSADIYYNTSAAGNVIDVIVIHEAP